MSYSDMLKLASNRAALIAILASLPFVGTATYFYVQIVYDRWPLDTMYHQFLGDVIFVVGGFPLTLGYALLIRYIASYLDPATNLGFLVVSGYILVFELQWIIWSQLIVLIWRRIVQRRELS